MKNYILSIILFLFFLPSISFAQTPCSDITSIAAEIGLEAPGFDIDVTNLKFEGGTCGTIVYNGQEIDGNSSVNFDVNLALGADELLCGIIDGEPPGISDVIDQTTTYSCEFNIMNVTGAMNAYAITFNDNPYLIEEKIVKGTVNRADLIQVYSPVATTIELPLSVSATLVAIQTFCDPAESVAEAKADLTASVAGVSVNLTGVARVEGGFLDNQYPSVSQVVSIPIYAGVRSFYMSLTGELSVRSKVLGLGDVIACGSNAVASADNSIDVGNFTGPNGGPLPEGMTIIGLDSGIDYVNPMNPLSCSNIPAPDIVVQDDNCASGTGTATVTPLDTLNYEWSNGATGAQASDLSYGTYFLTVSTL